MCDVIFYPCVILNKKPVFRVFPGFFLTVFGFGFFEEPPQPTPGPFPPVREPRGQTINVWGTASRLFTLVA